MLTFKPIANTTTKRALSQSQHDHTASASKKPKTDPIAQWRKIEDQIRAEQLKKSNWLAEQMYTMDAADEDASTKFGREIVTIVNKYRSDNVDRRDIYTGDTPLHIAAKHGNPVLVACLIALRADSSIKTADRKTLREITCTEIISPTYIVQLPSYKHTSVSIKHHSTEVAYVCQDPEFPPYKQIMDLLTQAGCPP